MLIIKSYVIIIMVKLFYGEYKMNEMFRRRELIRNISLIAAAVIIVGVIVAMVID